MGAGHFVGRVGGLAVALGVGAAVSLGSGVAWAEEKTGESTSEPSGDGTTGSPSEPGATNSTGPAPEPQSESETDSGLGSEDHGDEPDGLAPDAGADGDPADDSGKRDSRKRKNATAEADRSETREPESPTVSRTARLDKIDDRRSADRSVTEPAAVTPSSPANTVAPQPVPVISESTTGADADVVEMATAGPGVSPGDGVPISSPVEWVLLAAARREVGAENAGAVPAAEQTTTGQTAVTNVPPVILDPALVTDPLTGKVTGKINATDPEKKKLTYAVVGSLPSGVVFNAKNATFTFTPSTAQRVLAGLSATPVSVSFTVSVTDGVTPVQTTVAVPVSGIEIQDAGSIDAGGGGFGVVVSNTRAYVSTADGTITVIDTVNRTIVDTIELDSNAVGMALTPDGKKLYVAQLDDEGITVVNTANHAQSFIALPGRWADLLTVSPDGKTLYALTSDERSGEPVATVTKISTATGKVTGSVALPGADVWYDEETWKIGSFYALSVTPDSKKVYVIADLASEAEVPPSGLFAFSSTAKTATLIGEGQYFTELAISADGTRTYVNDVDAEQILVLDTKTNLLINTVANPDGNLGSLFVHGDGSVLIALDADTNKLVALDTRTGAYTPLAAVTTATPFDYWPGADISPDRTELYYVGDGGVLQAISLLPDGGRRAIGAPVLGSANPTTGAVSGLVTDTTGRKLAFTLVEGPGAGVLTVNKTTGAFTFTPTLAQRVLAGVDPDASVVSFTVSVVDGKATLPVQVAVTIDPVTVAGVDSVPVGEDTWGIAVTNNRAYVSNWQDGTIAVVDTITGNLLDSIDIGAAAAGLAVTPDGKKLFVAAYENNQVLVIDTATKAVARTITLAGKQPVSVAVSPNGKTVYVGSLVVDANGQAAVDKNGNTVGGTISKISTSTYKVTGTVTGVGYVPAGITMAPDGKKFFVISTEPGGSSSTKLYVVASNASKGTLISGVGTEPRAVAVNAAGTRIYVGGSGTTVYVLDGKNKVIDSADIGEIAGALALSKDGTVLLAKTDDGNIKSLDAATLEEISGFTPDADFDYATPGFLLSPDGMQAYTVTGDHLQVISLVPPNQFPAATAPTLSAPGTNGAVAGQINAVDPDDDSLTFTATSPAKGTLKLTPTGGFIYTPTAAARHAAAAGEFADDLVDRFVVTISDGRRGIITQTVVVTIAPANNVPTFKVTKSSPNSSTGAITVTVAGADKDKDALTYTVGAPALGSISAGLKGGTYVYTPTSAARHAAAAGGPTTDSFSVTLDDGHGGLVEVPVQVNISVSNAKPTVTHVVGQPNANTGVVTVTLTPADADGDTVTFVNGTTPKGTYTITGNTLTYTPTQIARDNAAKPGASAAVKADTLVVKYTDGHGGNGTVSIKVVVSPTPAGPVNQIPAGGGFTVTSTNPSTGAVTGTLSASDPDGDPITYTAPASTAKGTVSISGSTFTFTPSAAARHAAAALNAPATVKSETFTVTAADGKGGSLAIAVTVTISPANTGPTGGGFTVSNTNPSTGVVTGTLSATDANGDVLAYSTPATTSKGAVTISGSTFTFTPSAAARHAAAALNAPAAAKQDSFVVTVTDGFGGTATFNVTVTISPANSAPTGGGFTVTNTNGSTGVVTGTLSATDANGDTLTYTAPGTTSKGAITVSGSTFTYTPTAAARAAAAAANAPAGDKQDTFTVTTVDGFGGTTTFSVTVAITPAANSAPVNGGFAVTNTDSGTGAVTGTLSATDANGDPITYTAPASTAKGAVSISGSTFTFTPSAAARHAAAAVNAPAAAKSETFTVTASDGKGGTLTIAVTVTISPANSAPTGGGFTVTNTNGSTGVVTGTLSATDANGDTLTYTAPGTTSKGAITVSGNTFTYTPTAAARHAAAKVGAPASDKIDTFTVTAADGFGGSTTITVTVTIAPSNTAPTNVTYTVTNTNTSTGVVTGTLSATDANGDALTYTGPASTTKGALTITGATFTYTPTAAARAAAGVAGAPAADKQDVFTVNAVDGFGGTTPVTVTLTIVAAAPTSPALTIIGSVDLPGETGTQVNAGGTRAVLTTRFEDPVTHAVGTRVTVINAATGVQVGTAVTIAGEPQGAAQFSADGTRVLVTTSTWGTNEIIARIAVFDTTTGAQIGTTTTLAGNALGTPQLNADGTRALFTTHTYTGGVIRFHVQLVNTATGAVIGTPFSLAGTARGSEAQFSADGTRALMAYYDDAGDKVAVIDTATGAQIGSSLAVAGYVESLQFSENGTRALITSYDTDDATDVTTTSVAIVDTATGARIGATYALVGETAESAQFSADGTRVLVTTFDYTTTPGVHIGRVAVLNAASGVQISTFSVNGKPAGAAQFSVDATRVLVTAFTPDGPDNFTSQVTMFNAATGAQVGTPFTFAGRPNGSAQFNADGTRAFIAAAFIHSVGAEVSFSNQAAVFNPTTGAQIGVFSSAGLPYGAVWFSADGSRVLLSTQVGDTATVTILATAQSTNNSPAAGTFTIVNTNSGTGVVTGTVGATDSDGDALTYTGPVTTAKGTLAISGTTFTFTPSAAARHAAAAVNAPAAAKSETFTVTASDGKGGTLAIAVTVTISPANSAPTGGAFTVTNTDSGSGVVTGTLSATDANGDALTFSAPASTSKGAITVSGSTFTYTPTAAARAAAAAANAPAGDKQDTFTVTAVDGFGGTTTFSVTVTISPKASTTVGAGVSVIGSVTIAGENYDAVLNGAGTRAVVTTVSGDDETGFTTTVTVIDTTTGGKIGSTLTMAGTSGRIFFTEDGARALVTTDVWGSGPFVTRVAVINAQTGAQVGNTLTLAGSAWDEDSVQYNDAETRAVFIAGDVDEDTGQDVIRVTVVNLTTGAAAGATRTFAEPYSGDALRPVSVQLNHGGSRLVVTAGGYDDETGAEIADVLIISTDTGAQVGATLRTSGYVASPAQLSADGSHAVVASAGFDVSAETEVVVLNLLTGARVGSAIVQAGNGAAQLNSNGSRVIVNTADSTDGANFSTQISVYNTATGAKVGTSVTADGVTALPAQLNADGTRAVITNYALSSSGGIAAVKVVVINVATGAQVGSTTTVVGSAVGFDNSPESLQSPQISSNGTRVLVITTLGASTNFALIDTTTGNQLGSTVNLVGTADVLFDEHGEPVLFRPVFNDDGSRVFLTAVSGSSDSGFTTRFAVLNAVTGAQLGGTISLVGSPSPWADEADIVFGGNRVVFFSQTGDDESGYTSSAVLVNTDTGAQLGPVRTFTSSWGITAVLSTDGNRFTVTADTDRTESTPATTKLWVFDGATGSQVGSTLTFTGTIETRGGIVDDDPSRAVMLTVSGSEETGFTSTTTAIDLISATQIGAAVTLAGIPYSQYRDDDSTRLVVASVTGDAETGYTTTVNTLRITVDGSAPTNGGFTAGTPNATTGVVTGTVTATDPDGDALSFSGSGPTAKGSVTVGANGSFTFTPTAAARHAALAANATAEDKSDSFTVLVTDTKGNAVAVIVTVAVLPGINAGPINTGFTAGSPNAVTGVVSGTLTATDADGDMLTFSGPATTTKGVLSIGGDIFVYVPTEAARQAAAAANAPAAAKKDTFTVTVTDGFGGTASINVTVDIAPAITSTPATTVSAVGTVTIDGSPQNAYFNGDGTRAIVATSGSSGDTVVFSLINTATGSKVGSAVTVRGTLPMSVQFTADGSRAVLAAYDSYDSFLSVAIINMSNGVQVGTTYGTVNHQTAVAPLQLNSLGNRVAVTTHSGGSELWGRVVLINTATGATVYDGESVGQANLSFSGNGGRASVTFMSPTAVSSTVTFLNTTTGATIGAILERSGVSVVGLNADGTRAIISDYTQSIGSGGNTVALSSTVSLFNVGGSQIGSSFTVPQIAFFPAQFSADGSRAILAVLDFVPSNSADPYRTGVLVVNASTGAQVGSTVLVSGYPVAILMGGAVNPIAMNPNGTRAVLVARAFTATGFSTAARVAVVDLTTGTQVGSPLTLPGNDSEAADLLGATLSADGARALVTSFEQLGGTVTTRAVVINTETGAKLFEIERSAGSPVSIQLSADGSRLVLATSYGDETELSVLNAVNGTQVGTTVTVAGAFAETPQLSADGSRVVVTAVDADGETTRVVVLSTVTGGQIGSSAILAGTPTFAARVSDDGSKIVAATHTTSGGVDTTKATILKIT